MGTPIPIHGGIIPHRISLQNANTPDFNLERDVIDLDLQADATLLGMEAAELAEKREKKLLKHQKKEPVRFQVNVATIIISALIFILILAWFDFIQTAFYDWLDPEDAFQTVTPDIKLWYAIAATFFILILLFIVYYYFREIL